MNEFYIQSATPKQGCRRKIAQQGGRQTTRAKIAVIPCKTRDITGQMEVPGNHDIYVLPIWTGTYSFEASSI
jgi:hypothetical protein